jgi:hypothetical protein
MTDDRCAVRALKNLLHARDQRSRYGITLETVDMEIHAYENARRIITGQTPLLPYPPPDRRRVDNDD